MQRAPTLAQFLDILRRVTPASYHEQYLQDPRGAIALYRGWARTFALLSQRIERAASRQLLIPAPGFEPPSSARRATMTVVVQRSRDLDVGLLIGSRCATLEGPNVRRYENDSPVRWLPGDPEHRKTVTFESTLIGEPGNAEWLGNEDGLIVDPNTGRPNLRVTDLVSQSDQRSGTGAVLEVNPGELSTITDEGRIPTFRDGDVGLYLRIDYASELANLGRLLRVVGYSISPVESPPGSGLYPRTLILDDGPQAHLAHAVLLDDGGVIANLTALAQSPDAGDVALLPDPLAAGDALYVGAQSKFSQIEFSLSQRAYGDYTLVHEVWDGAAWVEPVGLVDGTLAFQADEGVRSISWDTSATTWAATAVDGITAYWIRVRCTATTSLSQQPLAGQVITYLEAPLQPELSPGEVSWSILDWRDLGVEIVSMTAPAGGRDDDLRLLGDERGYVQEPGELDEDFRHRIRQLPAVVSPNAIRRGVRRILEPYGIPSDVIDTQPGLAKSFKGLFCDTPVEFAPTLVAACDMYEPGHQFPTDDTQLVLSDIGGDRWHFWCCVPPPSLGQFGAFADSPAVYWLPGPDAYFGSACDYAFCDGSPWISAMIYRRVARYLDQAKMAGISWSFLVRRVDPCAL